MSKSVVIHGGGTSNIGTEESGIGDGGTAGVKQTIEGAGVI